jgi:hypothetical protein
MVIKIKIFECLPCLNKGIHFIGDRKAVREHLRKEHVLNKKAKFYGHLVGHKGNRTTGEKDERGILSRNCVF